LTLRFSYVMTHMHCLIRTLGYVVPSLFTSYFILYHGEITFAFRGPRLPNQSILVNDYVLLEQQMSFSIISVMTGIPTLFLYGLVSLPCSYRTLARNAVYIDSNFAFFASIDFLRLSWTIVEYGRSCSDGLGLGCRLYVCCRYAISTRDAQ
jgi:hypothetical protein